MKTIQPRFFILLRIPNANQMQKGSEYERRKPRG